MLGPSAAPLLSIMVKKMIQLTARVTGSDDDQLKIAHNRRISN